MKKLTRKLVNLVHLLNVSKLENSRKGDKSIWHILRPLTITNLRTLQVISMIFCNTRYFKYVSQEQITVNYANHDLSGQEI